MALENTFDVTDQQVAADFETANEQAALDVDNALVNGAEVDFSTAEDPFGDLGGLNVDHIKNTPENNTGSSITNQGGGPGDPVPKVKPALTMQDLINLSNKQKASLKNFSQSVGTKIEKYQDPMLAYGAYTFDQYASNVDRYRGYGKETFNKLGFNPLEDNEAYYNANTTGFQDFKRMTGQWGTLFNSAFFSSYGSLSNIFSSNGGLYDPDEEAAETYERAMKLGMSSKETAWGKGTNFTLNLAYTAGIAANIVAEELVLGALVTATGGGAGGVAGARTAANLSSLPSRLNRFERMMSLARQGLAQTSLGAGTQILKGGFQTIKSLKDIGNARLFYTGIKGGLTTLGKGTFDLLNPLRGTTKTLAGISEGTGAYRNLSNFAKMSKGFGAFYRDVRENLFAIGESQLEGGTVYNQVLDEQLKYYRETHNGQMPDQAAWATMYDNAQRAGEVDVLTNIPIIFLSNRFVFDGLFKFRGLGNAIDAAEEAATQGLRREITREAGTLTFKESVQGFAARAKGLIASPKVYAGSFLNYTKANIAEGIQENLQETAGAAISSYYINTYKNPVLGGHDYAKSMVWQAAKDNIWSPQGMEIFLNGFLMGGAMKGVTNSLLFTGKQLNNLYNSKFNKERYQEYRENQRTLKAKTIEALNGIMSDPEQLFGRRRESMVNQVRANQNMAQAELNNDDKTFYDSKDEKTFDHIFTALDTNTFDLVIDALQDMSNLSDSEIASAFNMSDGTKAKDKITEYIKRANEIKNVYGAVSKEYSNPFNPKKYKKTDPKYINEVLAYKSYEDAKKLVVASQFGFDRATQRLNELLNDLSTNSPVMSAYATDFTVLQNNKLLNAEIELLTDEVKQLSEGGPKQKELADKKKKKLNALIKYSNVLERYLASGKSQSNVNEEGKFEVPFNEELQTPLKEAYAEYLKAIANISDDKFVFDNKIDESFKKVLDIYNLDKDAQMYLQNLNGLLNPEMFARHAALINQNLSNIYEQREKLLADSLEEYFSINQVNDLTKNMAEYGVKLTEAELQAMVFGGQMPTVFLDMVSGEPIADTDPRVQKAKDAIETYLKLREDKLAEKQADEEARKEAAKEAAKPVEEKPKEETKPAAKAKVMPEDLKGRLQQAYDEFIDNNPDAVITFEEYIETSTKAAGIKDQYESEKKTTPSAFEEAENKLKEIWNSIGNNRGRNALEEGWAESFGYVSEALSVGGQNYQAHGMGKSGFPAALRDLFDLFKKGIDPSRGGGQLYTAPLSISQEDKAAAAAIGTAGGTAYTDGAFVLIAKRGVTGIRSVDDIGGILVNSGLTDINPEILTELRKAFPNLVIESYQNTKALVEQLNAKAGQPTQAPTAAPVSKVEDKLKELKQTPEGKEIENRRALTTVSDEEAAEDNYDGYFENRVSPEGSDEWFKTGEWIGWYINKAGEKEEVESTSEEELLKILNDRYDAELAALEGAKPTAPAIDMEALINQGLVNQFEKEKEDKLDNILTWRAEVKKKDADEQGYDAQLINDPVGWLQKFYVTNSYKYIESYKEQIEEAKANPNKNFGFDLKGQEFIDYATKRIKELEEQIPRTQETIKKVQAVLDEYNANLAKIGAKPTEAPTEVVTEKPVEKKPKPITIQNGKISLVPTPTDTFSEIYTFTIKDGKVVEGRHRTYFQGEYTDRQTDDPISNPAEEYDRLSAGYSEQQVIQDSSDVIKETSGTEKAKSILDSVSSIKELPTAKLTDNNAATAKLLDLVAEGKISSKDLLTLIEQRRNEILEKMNPTDLSKNDYVTFTDGRKGWVTSTNAKKNTVNVKMVGSAKGVVETIGAEDLRKNLVSVEPKKAVKVEAPEQVAVSKADKETITESRDTMDQFKNDAAKAKQIADDIANSEKTDNTDNLNNLLDSLGCDI